MRWFAGWGPPSISTCRPGPRLQAPAGATGLICLAWANRRGHTGHFLRLAGILVAPVRVVGLGRSTVSTVALCPLDQGDLRYYPAASHCRDGPPARPAQVLLQDGSWAWAQMIGRRQDRRGRWCIGIRWYASPSIVGRESWYPYRADAVRRPDSLSGRGHAGEHGRREVDRRDCGTVPDRLTALGAPDEGYPSKRARPICSAARQRGRSLRPFPSMIICPRQWSTSQQVSRLWIPDRWGRNCGGAVKRLETAAA